LLMFNGQNLETNTWAMVSIANVGIILLALLSIKLSVKSKVPVYTGLILMIITVFSNGNGMCIVPAISITMFLQGRKKESLWFAFAGALSVVGYFYNFAMPEGSSTLSETLKHPLIVITTFLSFIGNNFYLPQLKVVPVVVGSFCLITYCLAIGRKYWRQNALWFAFYTFLLLSAGMVAIGRADDGGGALRYRLYGSLFLVMTLMYYLENIEVLHNRHVFRLLLPCVAMYSILCTMLYIQKAEVRMDHYRVSAVNWHYEHNGLFHASKDAGVEELTWAESVGVYTMPELPLGIKSSVLPGTWTDNDSSISYCIDKIEERDGFLFIKGWAYTTSSGMDFTNIHIWLIKEGLAYRVTTLGERRYDIPDVPLSTKENGGFCAIISKKEVSSGEYTVGIEIQRRMIVPTGGAHRKQTDKKIAM